MASTEASYGFRKEHPNPLRSAPTHTNTPFRYLGYHRPEGQHLASPARSACPTDPDSPLSTPGNPPSQVYRMQLRSHPPSQPPSQSSSQLPRQPPSQPRTRQGYSRLVPLSQRTPRLAIGNPMGPVLKNGKPMTQETSAPSTAISYETAYPVRGPLAHGDGNRSNNAENIPPDDQPGPAKSKLKPPMSKSSRTLHALSSITQSFARSAQSLASFKSSRNFSGTSTSTLNTVNSGKIPQPTSKPASTSSRTSQKVRRLSFSSQKPKLATATSSTTISTNTTGQTRSPGEVSISTESEHSKRLTPPPQQTSPVAQMESRQVPPDPRLIYTAQSSAYWTGRFTALNDRYHSEVLDQETLKDVLEELSSRSRPSKHLTEQAGTTPNNEPKDPSPTLTMPKASSLYSGTVPQKPPRSILKPFPPTASPYTPTTAPKRPPVSAGISRLPFHTQPAPRRQSYDAPRSTHGTMAPPSVKTAPIVEPRPGPSLTATQRRTAILLTSDDHRHLRVFGTLASLCATPAASQSLKTWQTTYARRMGKEMLLPAGESMDERSRGRWAQVGRRSLSRGRRDVSVGSSNGGGGGFVSKLRMFSAGRRSQMVVKGDRSEVAQRSEVGGGSEAGKAWTEGTGGQGRVWVERQEGERRLRPRRIY